MIASTLQSPNKHEMSKSIFCFVSLFLISCHPKLKIHHARKIVSSCVANLAILWVDEDLHFYKNHWRVTTYITKEFYACANYSILCSTKSKCKNGFGFLRWWRNWCSDDHPIDDPERSKSRSKKAMLNHKSNFGSKIHWESVCIGITCLTNFYELVWFVQFQSQYFWAWLRCNFMIVDCSTLLNCINFQTE